MSDILKQIRRVSYKSEDKKHSYEWQELLSDYFSPAEVEDLSDFDRHPHMTFFININYDGSISTFFEEEEIKKDSYFFQISISADKPLASYSFLKYADDFGDVNLKFSSKAFLPEHKNFMDKYESFVAHYKLLSLTEDDLALITRYRGKKVSVYYKYFNPFFDNPRGIPISDQRVINIGKKKTAIRQSFLLLP